MEVPITSESWLRKFGHEAGNWSQRMNRLFSPNRSLTRPLWRTVRAGGVDFQMLPAQTRAVGLRFSAELTILPMRRSHTKQPAGSESARSRRDLWSLGRRRRAGPTVDHTQTSTNGARTLGASHLCCLSVCSFHQSPPNLGTRDLALLPPDLRLRRANPRHPTEMRCISPIDSIGLYNGYMGTTIQGSSLIPNSHCMLWNAA